MPEPMPGSFVCEIGTFSCLASDCREFPCVRLELFDGPLPSASPSPSPTPSATPTRIPDPTIDYNIRLEEDSCCTATTPPGAREQLAAAARRLERIIIQDVPDVSSTQLPGNFVDDVYIQWRFVEIDGRFGIAGSAGPRFVRSAFPHETVTGFMEFDVADYDADTFDIVFIHEMLHILGIGTLWNFQSRVLREGDRSSCTGDYFGSFAHAAYIAAGGSEQDRGGNTPPIQSTGSSGSKCSHWDEAELGNELMTPTFVSGTLNPLSAITIGGLEDLGYVVQYNEADEYTLPSGPLLASILANPMPYPNILPLNNSDLIGPFPEGLEVYRP
eukprot:CAMPEP_0182446488 /NCGR_PEP_ID=MMETSP1172-20130603/4236_1 /TAXON_ID=708627 /ORGANISM="Timspurckia oligopyrenoides, Strain CCMP3278" /LENGTH=328 /DNA_ID=CAMNT_0024642425 /DNA_START=229 /DNA_END=1215 /DNA_ORIENTATION=-